MPYLITLPCITTFPCNFWTARPGSKSWNALKIFSCWCFCLGTCVIMFSFGCYVLFNSEEKGVLDESDRFMMDPVGFAAEFAKNWSLPSHIVLFDSQEKLLKDFLTSHSFQEVKFSFFALCVRILAFSVVFQLNLDCDWQERRFFHAHFKVDRDLQASVVIYSLKGQ